MSEQSIEPLQFVSNVIELKPDRKYILAFKGITYEQLDAVARMLADQGITSIALALSNEDELTVIEVPVERDEQ